MATLRELIAQVRDNQASGYRRRRALEALATLREPEVAETLRDLLRDPDKYFRREVVTQALRRRGPEVAALLQEALADQDDVIRREAAQALGELGETACVAALQRLQQEPNYLVREAATRALEQLAQRGIGVTPAAESATAPESAAAAAPALAVETSAAPVPAPAAPAPTATPMRARIRTRPATPATATARLGLFFGEHLAEAQRRYAALAERQQRLPEVEARLRKVESELGWHRADKEDELAECDRQLAELDRRERELAVRQKAASSELTTAQLAHESFFFKVQRLFSSQVEVDHRRRCDGLQEQLQTLAGQLGECQRQREALLAEREALLEPIATRQASSAALADEHRELLAAWTEADQAVDQLYGEVLLTTPGPDLEARLQRLAQGALQPAFFAACVQAYGEAARRAAAAAQAAAAARDDLAAATDVGSTALAALGELVTASFGAQRVPREVEVRLSGTVSFRQEEAMFGTNGPSGTAQGTGTGTGQYEVDRLAWSPHPELGARTQVLAAAAAESGERAAALTLAVAEERAGRAALGDWLRLLRLEVERDPAVGGA